MCLPSCIRVFITSLSESKGNVDPLIKQHREDSAPGCRQIDNTHQQYSIFVHLVSVKVDVLVQFLLSLIHTFDIYSRPIYIF